MPKETSDFRTEPRETIHSNLSRRISGWFVFTSHADFFLLEVSLPNLADYKLLAPGDLSTPPDEDYMDPLGVFFRHVRLINPPFAKASPMSN